MLNLFPKSQKSLQSLPEGSLTRKTLIQVAISATLIVTAATGINYWQIFSTLRNQKLEQLEEYVVERVAREQQIFQLATDNHEILKREIIDRLTSKNRDNDELEKEFNRLFVRNSDGVIRNRPENFDGTNEAGVYIGKSAEITDEIRHKVINLKQLVESYGRAWHSQFQSTFVMTPENITVVYWPEVPTWAQDADANFYMPKQEEYIVANLENNPERKTVWTDPYFEEVSQLWLVTSSTPIDINDRPIATLGHDVRLNALIERTVNNNIEGGYNLIFTDDGQLIAHPELMDKIQDRTTPYKIIEFENSNLKDIFQLTTSTPQQQIIINNAGSGEYLAVKKIAGPDWYFVSVFPKSVLTQQAVKLALVNLLIAAILLLALLVIFSTILNTEIATPLNKLIEATYKISEGDYNVDIEENRKDEIGRLAQSFNLMAAEIATKNGELKTALDNQVQSVRQVTNTMNELTDFARSSATQASEASRGAKQVLLLIEGEGNEKNYSLQETVDKLTQQISDLNDKIARVGLISSVSSHLANQTNVLALNAAVEAVRVQENGQGFNVIATEIRKLADQSKTSAAEINSLIRDIKTAMNSTIKLTDESKIAFETAINAVNNIAENSEQISVNTHQQSVAIEEVLATMNHLETIGQLSQTPQNAPQTDE